MKLFKLLNFVLAVLFVLLMSYDLYQMLLATSMLNGYSLTPVRITVSGSALVSACLAMALVIVYTIYDIYEKYLEYKESKEE